MCIHLARVTRNGCRHVQRAADRYSLHIDIRPGFSEFAITATLGSQVDDDRPGAHAANGILGDKVEFVTGDTQTKSDAARASAKSMIEKDGALMITGGSSSGVAVAVQGLCQEAGVIFMAGLTHSNDTTGKDKKRNGFRHFFNAYMSGAALAPVLEKSYGKVEAPFYLGLRHSKHSQ